MTETVWQDTTDAPPPAHHPYMTATWLLGRHPVLAELVDRVPGAVVPGEGGEPFLDLDVIAEALDDYERVVSARSAYERQHRAPRDDEAYERWEAAAPQWSAAGVEVAAMSDSDQTRLALLATVAPEGARIRVGDFARLDDEGHELLRDWWSAVVMTS